MVLKREPLADWASNGGSKAWGGAPAPTSPRISVGGGRGGGGFRIGDLTDRRDLPRLDPRIIGWPPVPAPVKETGIIDVLIDLIKPKPIERVEPVSHIFGIPHSVSEIVGGVIGGLASTIIPSNQYPPPQLGFYDGWSPLDSSIEMFSGAYNAAKELNVAGENGAVGTFLGCPVEESDGCEPSKKRYTITIDNATGQCVKIKRQKSRKRRRRLASLSDIKDIAALKQVLGGGKALDTWIATRGR